MPRIISGTLRGRRLESPRDSDLTRPYPDRVKESVCNLLRGWFEDAVVVDLFAGVGTMALEAASRGAARVVAVERDRRVAGYLRRNIEALDLGDRVEVLTADALAPATLARIGGTADLVFLDPPYALMREAGSRDQVLEQAARCGRMLARPGFLVLRTPERPDRVPHPVPGLEGPEVHTYAGDMHVLLYAPPVDEASGASESHGDPGA